MADELYVWKSPRDLDADRIYALLETWQAAGGDAAASPFEPSSDVSWFYLELTKDEPELGASSDALQSASKTPVWLRTSPEPPPARVVRIPMTAETPSDVLDSVYGLAAKYDLVLYDTRNRGIHLPLEELADYATATFWPGGAIQAAVAGGIGLVTAVGAWFLGIPALSGIAIVIGGFLFVMAVYTFVHEGRKAMKARRIGREPPAGL